MAGTVLGAWVAFALLVNGAVFGYQLLQKSFLDNANKKFAETDSRVNSPDNVAFRKKAQEMQTSLAALDQLFSNQVKLSAVTESIRALTPKNVRLSDITVSPQNELNVSGVASSYEQAGMMVSSFKMAADGKDEDDPFVLATGFTVQNVAFQGATRRETGVVFEIKGTLVRAGSGATAETGVSQ